MEEEQMEDEPIKVSKPELLRILSELGVREDRVTGLTPFICDEDGSEYLVWHVKCADREYVLKQAKECELSMYEQFFGQPKAYAPGYYGYTVYRGKEYFLMEYCPGRDMRHCSRPDLMRVLDSLTACQAEYWENAAYYDKAFTFEKGLEGRERRGRYLNDPELESVYAEYLRLYHRTPRTLCHDDFLPFNVSIQDDRAVLIDWEYGGMLPYPTSLARLIAHGREHEDAYFYMTEADRRFAIDYYYEKLLKDRKIEYGEFRHVLEYFLFYEYCEWIMVGNRYGDTSSDNYRYSLKKAREAAARLKNKSE